MLAGVEACAAANCHADAAYVVRKTPSWPRSWANFSLFVAVFSQECMGQLASFGPT